MDVACKTEFTCKLLVLCELAVPSYCLVQNKVGACLKYENTPFTPPPPVLDELYNQLSSGMCLEIPRTTIRCVTLHSAHTAGTLYCIREHMKMQ